MNGNGTGANASRGSIFENNLFEIFSTPVGLYLKGAENTKVSGNGFWDGVASTYGVDGDSTATKNNISRDNFVDATGVTLIGPNISKNNYFPWKSIPFSFSGGGSALSGTQTACSAPLAFGGNVNQFSMTADVSGGATIVVRSTTTASYTGTAGFSGYTLVSASGGEVLSSAAYMTDTTLTSWTRQIAPQSIICVQLTSPSTIGTLTGAIQLWEGR
jgi:hypothetical protein